MEHAITVATSRTLRAGLLSMGDPMSTACAKVKMGPADETTGRDRTVLAGHVCSLPTSVLNSHVRPSMDQLTMMDDALFVDSDKGQVFVICRLVGAECH